MEKVMGLSRTARRVCPQGGTCDCVVPCAEPEAKEPKGRPLEELLDPSLMSKEMRVMVLEGKLGAERGRADRLAKALKEASETMRGASEELKRRGELVASLRRSRSLHGWIRFFLGVAAGLALGLAAKGWLT